MIRILITFTLITLIAIGAIGGCGGGDGGGGTGGGGNCDFIPEDPDGNPAPFTQSDCAALATNFDCEDFVLGAGTCEVIGCQDCLCSAFSREPFESDTAGCALAGALGNCANPVFQEDTSLCFLSVCLTEFPCGPIATPFP